MQSPQEESLRAYFEREDVLDHYARATASVGLWRSEESLCRRLFRPTDRLLDLGCGTGRIALGLHEIGYEHVLGVDFARAMVKRARQLATLLEYPVSFQVGDARSLSFDDALFDGVVFGFNGLMQIPGASDRLRALREIRRILRPGGLFLFTTHDREHYGWQSFWKEEAGRWEAGEQDGRLQEFGDRWVEADIGAHYIHVPTRGEVEEALQTTGWKLIERHARTALANEPAEVREFSDDCLFWVARRPE